MPNYRNRDEMVADENDATGGAMEVLNMYGANDIVNDGTGVATWSMKKLVKRSKIL